MELKFIDDTKVAIVEGVLSEEECVILHDYAVNMKLKESSDRAEVPDVGQYKSDSFINLDEGVLDYDLEELTNFWGSKNVFAQFAPVQIQDLVQKLKYANQPILSEYLKQIDNPKKNFIPEAISYDPIHVYSKGHLFDNHVDCHEFALVFYVSNPDQFTGGDLVYDAGPRITPTRGTLVIAPSEMPHEVLEVTSGFRCSLTTFLSATD